MLHVQLQTSLLSLSRWIVNQSQWHKLNCSQETAIGQVSRSHWFNRHSETYPVNQWPKRGPWKRNSNSKHQILLHMTVNYILSLALNAKLASRAAKPTRTQQKTLRLQNQLAASNSRKFGSNITKSRKLCSAERKLRKHRRAQASKPWKTHCTETNESERKWTKSQFCSSNNIFAQPPKTFKNTPISPKIFQNHLKKSLKPAIWTVKSWEKHLRCSRQKVIARNARKRTKVNENERKPQAKNLQIS